MASQIEICNQALTKIGSARITSLADTSKQAKTLAAIYDVKRDAELAAHPWSFAMARSSIPASTTVPAFGWTKAFPLPNGFLRLVEVGENYVMYQSGGGELFHLEGNAILCNEGSPLRIRYVQRVVNAGLYTPLFVEALACRLAAEVAEDMTQSISKREAAWQEWDRAIKLAKRTNAIELPPRPLADGSWWGSR
ncbi:hypothetical protein C1M51_02780 [Methylibium sp. Pch-M]|uniref:hypothetical protein n=1 Tax=Methylibium sp. Pch-M TaxID=2082386 RepID=UPI001013012B|nr:hypothetical protein [Methylibium sp. Pch-M]QAZ38430.1 hypothetical protein C1M51_02780 [Methylibium sp. Pch-M]